MEEGHRDASGNTAALRGRSPASSETHQDILVGSDARLSLDKDFLIIYESSDGRSDRCCGLLKTKKGTPDKIPYRNVLDASISDGKINIAYVVPTSKNAVRPAHYTHPLEDKTATAQATAWVSRLVDLAYGRAQRHKRIKVLVNPFGGKGLGPKIFANEAGPILRAAGCEVDAVETQHAGHAREMAAELDVDAWDVVACCSGDGTPHEVFNGLALQARPRRALRKVAVAQIPGGSGNALSLNFCGTDSPSLAALAIVKGVRAPFDLVSITQAEKRYLSFLSQAVGIVAECDLGTDNIRWMGSARFTYGFLVRLAGKNVYPAEVSVKVEAGDRPAIRKAYRETREGRDESWETKFEKEREAMDDEKSLPLEKYGTIKDPVPDDWTTQDMPTLGNFYCGNMCWMMPGSPFFAAALPNDGLADLITIDGETPRWTAIKMLLSVEGNGFFDYSGVDYRKVSAYRITPRLRPDQKQGYISIDGEEVDFAPYQAEVLNGIATVICVDDQGYHFQGPPQLKEAKT